MSLINLFWNLNISDTSKYLIVIGFFLSIFLLCFLNGKKNNTKKIKQKQKKKTTKCEENYLTCMQNNIKNNKNDFCYPCLDDGSRPDFFFDTKSQEWIKGSS